MHKRNSNSHFRNGSGAFRCQSCGRKTRDTGVQSIGNRNCPQCFDLASIYNVFQDDGDQGIIPYRNRIISLCEQIRSKGGTLDDDAKALLGKVTMKLR